MDTVCNSTKKDLSVIAFRVLMVLIWTQSTVLDFLEEVIERLPVVGVLSPFIIPTAIILAVIFSFRYIIRFVTPRELLICVVCLFIVLISILVFPKNEPFVSAIAPDFMLKIVPMLFVGCAFSYDLCKKDLLYSSIVVVVSMFAYQIYLLLLSRELEADNMFAAYSVLPSAMYIADYFFKKRNLVYFFLLLVSFILVILFGTRGPMLILAVFTLLRGYMYVHKKKALLMKLVLIAISAFILFFILSGDMLVSFAETLAKVFTRAGFSTRIFDFFISGNIAEGSGRDVLYDTTVTAIKENPVFGSGMMADRFFICRELNYSYVDVNAYAHNIFLEVWCHWGIFLGTALLCCIFGLPIAALIRIKDSDKFSFFLLLTVLMFIKLFVSGSYLSEGYLFFLIGMSFTALRKKSTVALK